MVLLVLVFVVLNIVFLGVEMYYIGFLNFVNNSVFDMYMNGIDNIVMVCKNFEEKFC